jgi:hypothetical protein
MSSLRIPPLAVAFLLLPVAALVGMADPAKAAPASGGFGTRDQLRECLALDDALKARLHDMELATVAHNQKFEANEAEGTKLVDMKAHLDRSDKAAILAFNQLVQEHHEHLQQVDQEADDADAAQKAYTSDRAAATQKCALTYRPADLDAVTKERKKAAAVSAGASAP